MGRIAYVNGQYLPHARARLHIEDRGTQFSDAAYEVVLVYKGHVIDAIPHVRRLDRSLGELKIEPPFPAAVWNVLFAEMIRRNRLSNGILYIQVSRGIATRDHAFPPGPVRPSVILTAKRLDFDAIRAKQDRGVSVITRPETRWARPDIKTVSLLGNVLAKQEAREAGAYEAVFVDRDGLITEGTSSNMWIAKGGVLQTRHLSQAILAGITRAAMMQVAADMGLEIREESFTVEEAQKADEAFVTSTTSFVMPAVKIDGVTIGNGSPGLVGQRLVDQYWAYVKDQAGPCG